MALRRCFVVSRVTTSKASLRKCLRQNILARPVEDRRWLDVTLEINVGLVPTYYAAVSRAAQF